MGTRELMVPKTGLTLQDQVELGRKMVVLKDKDARETLILNCVPMVKSLAHTFCFNRPSEYDDVFQNGILGVLEAIEKYDYTKNVKFTSYAYYYAQRRIITNFREQMPVKITERAYFNSTIIKTTIEFYVSNFQKEPTNEELAELTLLPLETVKTLRSFNAGTAAVDYDKIPAMFDGKNGEVAGDVAVLIEKAAANKRSREILREALKTLNENERQIIRDRYLSDTKRTLKELSLEQDVNITSIVKREKKALKKLLAYLASINVSFDELI